MSYALHIYRTASIRDKLAQIKKKKGGGWRDCPALLRLMKQWQRIKDKIHICALYYEM